VQKEEHRRNHFAIDDVERQESRRAGEQEFRRTSTTNRNVPHGPRTHTRGSGRRRHLAFAMQLSRYTARDGRVSDLGFEVSG
jgi:hypothetical protein